MSEEYAKGSTPRFELDATKDGVSWDLVAASATVTLYLRKPGGAVLTKSATLAGGTTTNVAYYDVLTTDLDTLGTWQRTWKVVAGTVTLLTVDVFYFDVVARPVP